MNQAEWTKQTAATRAAQAQAQNTRQKANEEKQKRNQIASLNARLETIQTNQINPALLEIKNLEIANKPLVRNYNDYITAHPKPWGAGELAAIALLQQPIDNNFKLIKGYNDRITAAENQKKQIQAQIDALNGAKKTTSKEKTKTSGGGGTPSAPQGKKIAFSKDYQYNAPMVKSAYFGMDSIQSRSLDGNHIDQGSYQDAMQAWKGTQGGRGTIQMDRKFLTYFAQNTSIDDKTNFDLQKYGFKFLYNPTTVSMAWGLMSNMDPVFESQGLDKFQPIATALMSSTVSFEIMLNRIADFDYLGPNGLRSSVDTSSIEGDLDPAQRNTLYSRLSAASNPYPETVSIEDQQAIYQKGTMYDIEYLLKTINGPDGEFTSALNGKTSDRAWMRPTIVELHLGNSMRYRVRISEFAVNHIFFNDRMVPTLSKVQLTCSRFNDGPESTTQVNSGGGSNSPASGLSNLRNTTPGYGR